MLYQRKNQHGGDLYSRPIRLDFSANTNPLGTPQSVRQAVMDSLEELHQYPDPYCRTLVADIAEFEKVPEESILCGNGAAELIYAFCRAKMPKRALELAPTFSEYRAALESVGCRVEQFLLKEEQDFLLTEEILPVLETGRWDCIFLCNPNNPTGQTIPPELLEQIAEICKQKKMTLFLDECFQDLTDEEAAFSMKRCLKENNELFILKAFTKSYGMAALRLGYGLCQNAELLSAMSCAVQSWNVSLPAQRAGCAALKEQAFLKRSKALIRQERSRLKKRLIEFGFRVIPSQVNYLCFRGPLGLKEQLLEQGIQIRDCGNYRGLCAGWYRIAVKNTEENEELLTALQKIMERSDEKWQNAL